jgi:hypothetical protein
VWIGRVGGGKVPFSPYLIHHHPFSQLNRNQKFKYDNFFFSTPWLPVYGTYLNRGDTNMFMTQSVLQVPAGLRLRRQGQIRPGPRRGQPKSLGLSIRLVDAFLLPATA